MNFKIVLLIAYFVVTIKAGNIKSKFQCDFCIKSSVRDTTDLTPRPVDRPTPRASRSSIPRHFTVKKNNVKSSDQQSTSSTKPTAEASKSARPPTTRSNSRTSAATSGATNTLEHSYESYVEKRDGKTSDLPTELWTMILRLLPSFADIANAIIAKRSFRMMEDTPKVFMHLGLEDLETLYNDFYRYKKWDHVLSLLDVYKEFLKYPLYKAAAYVLLWKLFSIIPFEKTDYLDLIEEVMTPFVKAHVDGINDTKRYTQFKEDLAYQSKHLSVIHHVNILYRFDRTYPHETDGWRQFGYMLLLESSNHLTNKIPYETMLTMLDTYCSANGQYILHINSIESDPKNVKKSGELQVEKRFELNWNFYKGKVTKEFKIRSSVICASTAVRCLSRYYDFYHDDRKKFEYAQVIGAIVEILSLKPDNFLTLVDDTIRLNFVFFDLAAEDPFIQKSRKWLEDKCKGSRALSETGFKEQMTALKKFNKNGSELSDADAFCALQERESMILRKVKDKNIRHPEAEKKKAEKRRYLKQLKTSFIEKCNVDKMEDFKDYIEILKIVRNICTLNQKLLKQVWNAFLSFVEKPSLFNDDNLTELFEVDELHTSLFRIGSSHVEFETDWEARQEAKDLLDIAYPNFEHIFEIKDNETERDRRQRRILLKILLMLANRAFDIEDIDTIDQAEINRMNRINKLIYRLAKDDDLSDVSPSQDPCFLNEWFINTFQIIPEVANEINPNSFAFNFIFEPIEDTTKPSYRSPLFYQCILNTLEWTELDDDNRTELRKNLFTIGAAIEQGKPFKRAVEEAFAQSKNEAYSTHLSKIVPYQNNDLKVFVESTIDHLIDKHLTVGLYLDSGSYKAISLAVTESRSSEANVKAKIGKELIEMLDQMFQLYFQEHRKEFKKINLREVYKDLGALLGLTLIEFEEEEEDESPDEHIMD